MTEPIHILHPALWENLSAADPEDVCRRAGVTFDGRSDSYEIEFLNERHRIHPGTLAFELVRGPNPGREPSVELKVAVITYLLSAQPVALTGKLVAPTSLKGGKTFFQGSHHFPLDPLVQHYGGNPEGFVTRGLSLGATHEQFGDASLRFPALPRLPVTMVLWAADDEFAARLSVLFDSSADKILPLDAIYGVVSEICGLMVDSGR